MLDLLSHAEIIGVVTPVHVADVGLIHLSVKIIIIKSALVIFGVDEVLDVDLDALDSIIMIVVEGVYFWMTLRGIMMII